MDLSSELSSPPSSPLQLPQQNTLNTNVSHDTPNNPPSDDDIETESNTKRDYTKYKLPLNTVVDNTVEYWRTQSHVFGYGFERFLEGWLSYQTDNPRNSGAKLRSVVKVLRKPHIIARLKTVGVDIQFAKNNSEDEDDNSISQEVDKVSSMLRKEFSLLISQPAFNTFSIESFINSADGECAVKDVGDVEWINDALTKSWPQIQVKAPTLARLLGQILIRERAEWNSYQWNSTFPTSTAYLITSVLLHSFAPRRSTFLLSTIGLYLHNSGVPRRVIDTLARLGISSSYKVVMDITSKAAEQARKNLKRAARDPTAVKC
ncbi:uncharacterized protein GGS25DRAFT_486344 [Hypoxylon fragiforme]|uniref:uncharacterized protein n=1 Tax=Hypoxylon fragiforme TaxID=63214 RepID=UPI0020C70DB2|nr:uncharacterized protein GGS25DRAFT_486344 [Hypoxylon fragiforme]KAI2609797.1 hypothetical protein GGS25DRAFT_486344 [Hypoxylon fragiforme]